MPMPNIPFGYIATADPENEAFNNFEILDNGTGLLDPSEDSMMRDFFAHNPADLTNLSAEWPVPLDPPPNVHGVTMQSDSGPDIPISPGQLPTSFPPNMSMAAQHHMESPYLSSQQNFAKGPPFFGLVDSLSPTSRAPSQPPYQPTSLGGSQPAFQATMAPPFRETNAFLPSSTRPSSSEARRLTTQGDRQTAPAFYNTAPPPPTYNRAYSSGQVPTGMGGMDSSVSRMSSPAQTPTSASSSYGVPMVATPHGQLHEQLARLLPLHSEIGTIDAQLTAQFTQIPQAAISESLRQNRRPSSIRRQYTYGTDTAFNPNGYVSNDPEAEKKVTEKLDRTIRHSLNAPDAPMPAAPRSFKRESPRGGGDDGSPDVDEDGDEEWANGRSPKRRKSSTAVKKGRNGSFSNNGISKKDPSNGRKKRIKTRENLSEHQKRANHIASEQTRRNRIKSAFEDLTELCPKAQITTNNRAATIHELCDYLVALKKGNEELKARLKRDPPDMGGLSEMS